MCFDDLLADIETQTQSSARRAGLGPPVRFEYPRQQLRWNRLASIGYREYEHPFFDDGAHHYRCVRRPVRQRVREQIGHELLKTSDIASSRGKMRGRKR